MIEIPKPDGQKYLDYVERMGRKSNKTIEILKQCSDFLKVFNTPEGEELLSHAVSEMGRAFEAVSRLDPPPTVEERAYYKAIFSIINSWSTIIRANQSAVDAVNGIDRFSRQV